MDLATSFAASELDLRPEKVAALKEHAKLQRSSYDASDIRLAAALMKTACDMAGDSSSQTYFIFKGLLHNSTPTPGKQKLASIVYTCLGRVKLRQEKQAGNPLATIFQHGKAILGGSGMFLADLTRMGAMAGMATGGIGAAGLWAAKRGIDKEDEKLRQLEIQRDTYGQLNAEVKAELERRRMEPTPTNTAAAVDYLT